MRKPVGDALERQFALLLALPRTPVRRSAAELSEQLAAQGFDVSRRTVERDLQALSRRFPLQLDDRSKPYGWSWMRNAEFRFMPQLSASQAVALLLAQAHLDSLLPQCMKAELAGLFGAASKSLSTSGWKDWHRRTAIVPTGFSLMPPLLDAKVLAAVQTALSQRKCLRATYRPKWNSEDREYRIHPQGLIARGSVLYLVATLFDYEDVRQLALHRMTRVDLLDEPRREPAGFDFAAYAGAQGSRIASRGPIRLVCRFDAAAAEHLLETPLSADQSWTALADGRSVEVSATVEDDDRLRWWLQGFGSLVEVLAPEAVRNAIGAELRDGARMYRRG